MGSWGPGLYDNDIAMDLRDDFRTVCRAPWDGDALLAWAMGNHPMAADPGDDDFTDARLVLADLFWVYGIEHAETSDVARRIIADGTDLAAKGRLGMGEPDLRRRARVLAALDAKWREANPKPRPRRILAEPQAFLFVEGDCLVYPTSRGELRNPYISRGQESWYYRIHPWTHDGWGAAIVLATRRQYDVFACHVLALLAANATAAPGIADFPSLHILHTGPPIQPAPGSGARATRRQVNSVTMSRPHRQHMRVETVGQLSVRQGLVASEVTAEVTQRYWDNSLANVARFGAVGARLVDVDDPITRYVS